MVKILMAMCSIVNFLLGVEVKARDRLKKIPACSVEGVCGGISLEGWWPALVYRKPFFTLLVPSPACVTARDVCRAT
jgi:hypothetical protein